MYGTELSWKERLLITIIACPIGIFLGYFVVKMIQNGN